MARKKPTPSLYERACQSHGRRLPVQVSTDDPVELAKCLIHLTGSPAAARIALMKAAAAMKKPRGQPSRNEWMLIEGDRVWRESEWPISINASLTILVRRLVKNPINPNEPPDPDDVENLVRVLRRRLNSLGHKSQS